MTSSPRTAVNSTSSVVHSSGVGDFVADRVRTPSWRIQEKSIGRVAKASHAIFLGATKEAELGRIGKLKASLRPDGALWVIRPKGRPEISEMAVMRAGQAAGLVDVKVVSFSATHTAEKLVIPVKARK